MLVRAHHTIAVRRRARLTFALVGADSSTAQYTSFASRSCAAVMAAAAP